MGQALRTLSQRSRQCVWKAWVQAPQEMEQLMEDLLVQSMQGIITMLRQMEHVSASRSHFHRAAPMRGDTVEVRVRGWRRGREGDDRGREIVATRSRKRWC